MTRFPIEYMPTVPARASSGDALSEARRERVTHERQLMTDLLHACGGNIAEMSRRLNVTRSCVHYRLRKYGLMESRSKVALAAGGLSAKHLASSRAPGPR